MIEINMNTARLKLTVKGHAKPEETKDYALICSAVSAMAQALVWSISKMDHAEGATRSIQYRDDPGDYFLLVIAEQWAENMIKHRFRNFGDGLEMLAKAHTECIDMIWDGEKILAGTKGEASNE